MDKKKKFSKAGMENEVTATSFGVFPDKSMSDAQSKAKRFVNSLSKTEKGSFKKMKDGMGQVTPGEWKTTGK